MPNLRRPDASDPMDFLDTDTFIRLAHTKYALPLLEHKVRADLDTLIATTRLSHNTLAHVLYYLHLLVTHKTSLYHIPSRFTSSSREKLLPAQHRRSGADLFELLVVLMMVANKANDDSSYTMKTWENLTPLSIPYLRRREVTVLRKLNYNVFLKGEEHTRWCDQLRSLAQDCQVPELTPPQLSPSHLIQSSIMPKSNTLPLTPRSPRVELEVALNKRKLPAEPYMQRKKQQLTAQPQQQYYLVPNFPQQLLTPLKSLDNCAMMVPSYPHPLDCTCCALTRMTDVYHNLLKSVL